MAYRHAGFTLIEMVMMLILIGILAVVFVPRAPSKGSLTIAGQAQQLASDLRYVQALSMTRMTSSSTRYCLKLSATGYSLVTSTSNCTTTVEHPLGISQPVPTQDAVLSWSNLPNNYVVFNGKGVPYTDAAASSKLASNAVITLSGGGVSNTVTISPETGRVMVGP